MHITFHAQLVVYAYDMSEVYAMRHGDRGLFMDTEVPTQLAQAFQELSEWSNQHIPRCSQSQRDCLPVDALLKTDLHGHGMSFAGARKGHAL